jgi:hypothetical protein
MIDINPSFVPRTVKPLPFQVNNVNRPSSVKGKGKGKDEPESGGLLEFFGISFLSAGDTLMFNLITQPQSRKPPLLVVIPRQQRERQCLEKAVERGHLSIYLTKILLQNA